MSKIDSGHQAEPRTGQVAQASAEPKAAIVVLNWNGWRDTVDALESLYGITYTNYDVVLVDNGSRDDSIARLREWADGELPACSPFISQAVQKPVRLKEYSDREVETIGRAAEDCIFRGLPSNRKLWLIRNQSNYGFAEGCNVGMRFALNALEPEYILLLNNDVAVDPNFLRALIEPARSDERIGIAGPRIYHYYEPSKLTCVGFKIILWKGRTTPYPIPHEGEASEIRDVDSVSGSCLLISRSAIQKIGLLDKEYFAYWEETDWCLKAKKAGYRIVHVPTARIWHKGEASTKSQTGFVLFYMTRNRVLFVRKNASTLQKLAFMHLFLIDFVLSYCWARLREKDAIKASRIARIYWETLLWHIRRT